MKRLCKIIAPLFSLLIAKTVQSQNRTDGIYLQPAPLRVTIDGSLEEWGDSLRYCYNIDKLYYTLANDKENVYFAIRINAGSEIERAVRGGITMSVNPDGNQNDKYSITYIAGLKTEKNIFLKGFDTTIPDSIGTDSYGIRAASATDKYGYFICEGAIPIKLLNTNGKMKNEWFFHIRINRLYKPKNISHDKIIATDGSHVAFISATSISGSLGGNSELLKPIDIRTIFALASEQ
jgi:hypothetical protein